MKESKRETVKVDFENNPLYKKLFSFQNNVCTLILKDGVRVTGKLNHVLLREDADPMIVFDMGDSRVSQKYNLRFNNIEDVVS